MIKQESCMSVGRETGRPRGWPGESADLTRQGGLEHICAQEKEKLTGKEKSCDDWTNIDEYLQPYNGYSDSHPLLLPSVRGPDPPHTNTALEAVSGCVCCLQSTLTRTVPRETWKGQEGRINLNVKVFELIPSSQPFNTLKKKKKTDGIKIISFDL